MDLDDSRPGRSSVGKLLVAGAAVAAGFAAWWMFGRGKGEPEDPARVLIVGSSPELVDFLDRKGFDPEHLSYGDAVGQGQAFDGGLDDVAAIVEFADRRGFGYVALDLVHHSDYAFADAGYEVDAIPAGSTFAVLAVGRIGRDVSFGGVVEGVHHEPPADAQAGLLLALFGQPELAKARSGDAINDLMIRFGAGRTLDELAAYEKAQTTMRHQIAAWEALRGRERGDASLVELAAPYEPLQGWPLADGSVLIAAASHAWHSPDGQRSEWSDARASASLSLVRLDAPHERVACSELPDTLPFEAGVRVGPGGDALLIPSDAWVAQLWVREGDEGCGFVERDPIRRLANGELGQPRASGRTAEALAGGLMWADAKKQAYRSLQVPGIDVHESTLAWLDDDLVAVSVTIDYEAAAAAAASRETEADAGGEPLDTAVAAGEPLVPAPARDAVMLVRLPSRTASSDDAAVEVVLLASEPGRALSTLWPVWSSKGAGEGARASALIVRGSGGEGDELVRIELGEGLAWSNPLQPEWKPTTDLAGFTRVASLPADIEGLVVDRAGTHASWAAAFEGASDDEARRGHELVLLSLAGAPAGDGAPAVPRRLTSNEVADVRPRFAGPDQRWIVFESTRTAAEDLPAVTTLRGVALD